ncbi:MAG: hypothetical protein IPM80_02485 [Proteobacteria bacterium]|nr:hypothetical protein [Pseudomonadota bacterium]
MARTHAPDAQAYEVALAPDDPRMAGACAAMQAPASSARTRAIAAA